MREDDTMVDDYLAELEGHAARHLTTTRRHELVDDIREHITAAITSGESPTSVLARLGTPAEIVAAESPDVALATALPRATPPPRLRGHELAAIVLLLIGGVLVGIGWLVGAVLLWTSDRWNVRDKIIGTVLWPGGLVLPVVLGGGVATSSSETCADDVCTTVTTGSGTWPLPVQILLAVVVLGTPIATSFYLARRARVPATGG